MNQEVNKKKETQKDKILNYLISLIYTGKVKPNQMMPSEHTLMDRFYVSRITIINAYQKLESVGAVYTKRKLGHYAAENFFGMIKPFSFTLQSEDSKTVELDLTDNPQWFQDFNIKFDYGWKSFYKEYYKNEKVFMYGEHYISKKYELPVIDGDFSFTDFLLYTASTLKDTVYKLRYEKVDMWGYEYLVVVYFWGYDSEGICLSSKYIVHPDDFEFSHQETSLT